MRSPSSLFAFTTPLSVLAIVSLCWAPGCSQPAQTEASANIIPPEDEKVLSEIWARAEKVAKGLLFDQPRKVLTPEVLGKWSEFGDKAVLFVLRRMRGAPLREREPRAFDGAVSFGVAMLAAVKRCTEAPCLMILNEPAPNQAQVLLVLELVRVRFSANQSAALRRAVVGFLDDNRIEVGATGDGLEVEDFPRRICDVTYDLLLDVYGLTSDPQFRVSPYSYDEKDAAIRRLKERIQEEERKKR